MAEWLRLYQRRGAERCYLRLLDITDVEQLELIAAEVLPQVEAGPVHTSDPDASSDAALDPRTGSRATTE